MRERPILFSGSMVRAILDGRKTQTRRVVKLPHNNPLGTWEPTTFGGPNGGRTADGRAVPLRGGIWHTRTGDCLASPYGAPGDRLWVRETWNPRIVHSCFDMACDCETVWVDYQAGGEGKHFYGDDIPDEWYMPQAAVKGRPVPSLHMPRWASRILLEITDVRVERLQAGEGETSFESRYLAEGVNRIHHGDGDYYYSAFRDEPHPKNWVDPFDAFGELWDSINGAGAWDANPWVWVVQFRRV